MKVQGQGFLNPKLSKFKANFILLLIKFSIIKFKIAYGKRNLSSLGKTLL